MKGFHNIGNTCYLNSGLQMLIQNKDLCNLIIQNSDNSEILSNISNFINEYYDTNNNQYQFLKQITNIKLKDFFSPVVIFDKIIMNQGRGVHSEYNGKIILYDKNNNYSGTDFK